MPSSLTASGCHVLGVSVVKETVGLAVLDSQESWGGGGGIFSKKAGPRIHFRNTAFKWSGCVWT